MPGRLSISRWKNPLEIPVTDRSDVGGAGSKNDDLYSISVRKGCKLTAIDEKTFGSDVKVVIEANGGADKHVNLDSTSELQKVEGDVEAVICECPGEVLPVFSRNA